MNADEIVRQLRGVQEKHAHDKLLTFQTDISAMARDCANMIESLQAQLAAEKRRADAAVEDLTKLATRPIAPCHSCSKTCVFPATLAPELQPAPWCRDWEWRGVKEEA